MLTYRNSFFTDPTISTLTSGTPSMNADMSSLSFPRRIGIRFHADFVAKYNLVGMQVRWMSYEDAEFTKPMGKDFAHEDIIQRAGWANYYFKGKYPKDTAYIKLEIVNPQTGVLARVFYFKFTKLYQMSLDARRYIRDPVLGTKIIKDGVVEELSERKTKDGRVRHVPSHTTFKQQKIVRPDQDSTIKTVNTRAIIQTSVRYTEKPKIIFLVTPPHLMKYAKLILILIKQLVDLNFDQSYMTKANQKPLFKTRFMLDELGNLQSEGHGIEGFATMLSIGLGQEQQFTLILQTLQQLKDVYGDSVDKIVQGNTNNIVFLKSTDDSMIDTLTKMSGQTHEIHKDSVTLTTDKERILLPTEGKISETISVQQTSVLKYNDFAFLPERNSIVLRAGDMPIMNRNETIMPMSWKLLGCTIKHPGHTYSLQTIPTLSSAIEFDVRQNQPDFIKMLDKRLDQAYKAEECKTIFKEAYGYDDYQVARLDQDLWSNEIMEMIDRWIKYDKEQAKLSEETEDLKFDLSYEDEENEEQINTTTEIMQEYEKKNGHTYANGLLRRDDLCSNGVVSHAQDRILLEAFKNVKGDMFNDKPYFRNVNGELHSVTGVPYIVRANDSETLSAIKKMADDGKISDLGDNVTREDVINLSSFVVTDEFIRFLVSLDYWSFARGRYEQEVARLLRG